MPEVDRLIRYRLRGDAPAYQHGQGEIWAATDLLFDDRVAIKFVKAGLGSDASALESFRKEAAVGARLSRVSPNVVPVRDYGCTNDRVFFVMDWIEGDNLSQSLGRLTMNAVLSVLRPVTAAVQLAHASGVVHSDIAPANILRHAATRQVYLADFGYLKIVDTVLVSAGHVSLMVGGRRYFMPLEHLCSPSRINGSTDVYALALTMHMLLTGEELPIGEDGAFRVPGVLMVKREGRPAPDLVRQILERFVVGRSDADTADEFRGYLDRL